MNELIQLTVLFLVLFDPFASLAVFFVGTRNMNAGERRKTGFLAVGTAAVLSFATLFLGNRLLTIFDTNIDDFRIAGGIILILLGIKMALGLPLTDFKEGNHSNSRTIAVIIATPLMTGPAVISSIIITKSDFGIIQTGLAILIVLVFTALLLQFSNLFHKILMPQNAQIISTFLGLITISWGINFLRTALEF